MPARVAGAASWRSSWKEWGCWGGAGVGRWVERPGRHKTPAGNPLPADHRYREVPNYSRQAGNLLKEQQIKISDKEGRLFCSFGRKFKIDDRFASRSDRDLLLHGPQRFVPGAKGIGPWWHLIPAVSG